MNIFHVSSELRRFARGTLPPVALLTVILLPLLFGGLFVWSYWDPVGRINQLPVALVNSDTGAEDIHAGDTITEKLLSSDRVTFSQVDAQQAKDGVANGRFYFALELPADFSAAVVSVRGDHPHQATLNTTFNNDNGVIASTLGNQVVGTVLSTINAELGAKVTDRLLVGFSTLGQGLDKADAGSARLAEGTTKTADGSGRLADGAAELHDNLEKARIGAEQLAAGQSTLADGIDQARTGAQQLAAGVSRLDSATAQLGDGAAQVAQGVNRMAAVAQQAQTAQENLLAPLVTVSTQLKQLEVPEAGQLAGQVDDIVTQVRQRGITADTMHDVTRLRDGAAEIARQLADPAAEYAQGMKAAASGSEQLAAGMDRLQEGSQALVVGTRTLAAGTSQLAAGSQQLTVGARQLHDGTVELDAGAKELALKLHGAATQVPRFPAEQRPDSAHTMSTPVAVQQQADNFPLFGIGLAPVFISLGLFMGSTMTWMLLKPLQRRAVDSGLQPLRVVLASYLPAVAVGIGQATIMFAVQHWFLGLNASQQLGMWGAMCLTALTFQMITLGINSALGTTVGRVVCLILMNVQIVSSGGIYPHETQPSFLRWFHTYDPMTFSVDILRQMVFHVGVAGSTADARLFHGVLTLAGIWTLFLLLAMRGARKSRQWRMKELFPEVSV